jgi:hypothetical protein
MVIDSEDEEANDFKIKMILNLDGDKLMDIMISINFSGGEVSNRLSTKFKFTPESDFNYVLTSKMRTQLDED